MNFFTKFRVAGIAVFVLGMLFIFALNLFGTKTPVTFDSKKAELIKFADAEKEKELSKAAMAYASGSFMKEEASALIMKATALNIEGDYAISWAASCRAANVGGTIESAVDCDTIAVTDAEPVATGATATGSVKAVPNSVIAPASDVPELIVETPEQELLSEIDRSDSHLAEIAKRLVWKYNANGFSQSPVGLTASGVADRSKQMLRAYKFDERFGLTKHYGWELFKKVGDRYHIKPEFLVCVAKADSSLGRWLKTDNNIGNVGNNDRGNRVSLPSIGAGIDHIGLVLTNKYLGYKQSVGSLSPVGGGDSPYYSTSKEGNWYNNVRNCLAEIYNDSSVGPNFMFRN